MTTTTSSVVMAIATPMAKNPARQLEAAISAADRFAAAVRWLADDRRQGRGVGSAGLERAASWLEEQFRAAGAEGGVRGGFRQTFSVPLNLARGAGTGLTIDGTPVAAEQLVPLSFSASPQVVVL